MSLSALHLECASLSALRSEGSLTEVQAALQGQASCNRLLECTASRLARLCFGALRFFEPAQE